MSTNVSLPAIAASITCVDGKRGALQQSMKYHPSWGTHRSTLVPAHLHDRCHRVCVLEPVTTRGQIGGLEWLIRSFAMTLCGINLESNSRGARASSAKYKYHCCCIDHQGAVDEMFGVSSRGVFHHVENMFRCVQSLDTAVAPNGERLDLGLNPSMR